MKSLQSSCENIIAEYVKSEKLPQEFLGFAEEICEGAVRGLDIHQFNNIEEWAEWLSWASVVLDERDYLTAAVHALRLAPGLPATDYGTARQRDLGQQWTDAIRGLLGEIAFAKWFKLRFGIEVALDFSKGRLEEFLPSDIKKVSGREPRLNTSIKTTKFRGVWLDVPYAQIKHSDVFVLVRVGVTREHFLAFLKKISVIRDKILSEARRLEVISDSELEEVWGKIPEFKNVPAYVAGFLYKKEFASELEKERVLVADCAVRGRKKTRLVINKFLGYWDPRSGEYRSILLEKCRKALTAVESAENIDIEFEGIGSFSETLHFIASSGVLKRKQHEWEVIAREI
ncbi:MAG: hypothetical protein QXO02_05790 [Thermofilaceae archaeon]|uniref:hypothetical protein n=1 Tax=Pyrobaculum sp. TaxID=2004705 RepID=UPI003160A30B